MGDNDSNSSKGAGGGPLTKLAIYFGGLGRKQQGIYRLDSSASIAAADDEKTCKQRQLPPPIAIIPANSCAKPIKFQKSNQTGTTTIVGTFRKRTARISKGTLLKYISLFVLILQTAVQVLYVRYATTTHQNPADKRPWLKTVVVFYSEVIKLATALLLYFLLDVHGSAKKSMHNLYEHLFRRWSDMLRLSVPALAYTVQSFLIYVALEHLDAGTYTVTYQLKILTTAMFTVLLLGRHLSVAQWLALLMLLTGVVTVQISAEQNIAKNNNETATATAMMNLGKHPLEAEIQLMKQNETGAVNSRNGTMLATANGAEMFRSEREATERVKRAKLPMNETIEHYLLTTTETVPKVQRSAPSPITGLISVIAACFLSGFSGVYIEKLLKQSRGMSVWLQNVQLSTLAIPISFGVVLVQDGQKIWSGMADFNQGFDLVVWGVVLLQSFGGLIIAMVIKYADNILKAFATSLAIIVISLTSIVLFQLYPKPLFAVGSALVIGSLILYSMFPYNKNKLPKGGVDETNEQNVTESTTSLNKSCSCATVEEIIVVAATAMVDAGKKKKETTKMGDKHKISGCSSSSGIGSSDDEVEEGKATTNCASDDGKY